MNLIDYKGAECAQERFAQEQITPQSEGSESTEGTISAEASQNQAHTVDFESLDDNLDSVLDDIEAALETNAEEYVQGFVQKGGE